MVSCFVASIMMPWIDALFPHTVRHTELPGLTAPDFHGYKVDAVVHRTANTKLVPSRTSFMPDYGCLRRKEHCKCLVYVLPTDHRTQCTKLCRGGQYYTFRLTIDCSGVRKLLTQVINREVIGHKTT
ncbi:hypothetical protein EDC04DRAFT_2642269 [Pisolithus marmoratus]|nr:hypothetical protein EDC04DRAFT_2642269 [Pisolithus marmoratus]